MYEMLCVVTVMQKKTNFRLSMTVLFVLIILLIVNTTNINELQLEYISADYLHASITLDELEKELKLTKNGKTPGQDNINSELYKYAPEEFKLRLLQFLNNIYRENCIPDEWRNAVITPIFKKGDKGTQKLQRN